MAQRNDIEDVLSSIRRLVANEAVRPIEEPDAFVFVSSTPETASQARTAPPALVLDQTQRVTEPEDPFQTVQGMPDRAHEEPNPVADEDAPEQAPKAPNVGNDGIGAPVFDLHGREPLKEIVAREIEEVAPEQAATSEQAVADARATRDAGALDLSDLSNSIETDEALRELIAEIVRQELAGALGERITRNVRKLVRRELRQMMSGEEFD